MTADAIKQPTLPEAVDGLLDLIAATLDPADHAGRYDVRAFIVHVALTGRRPHPPWTAETVSDATEFLKANLGHEAAAYPDGARRDGATTISTRGAL